MTARDVYHAVLVILAACALAVLGTVGAHRFIGPAGFLAVGLFFHLAAYVGGRYLENAS